STNSLVHGEGISNSILEYMAMSKAVIASSGGGTDEIVVHGKTGYLVQPSQVGELAGRIHELLDNQALRDEMGKKGYKRVYEHFNLNKMAKRYYDIYTKVLNN
ncbi:MAG: glycosyltransferase family 4 protein, partial [Bacteroidota bacterium]